MSFQCVQRDDNALAVDRSCEPAKKRQVHFSAAENRASNDHLTHSPSGNFLGAGNRANSAAEANFHSKFCSCLRAQRASQFLVRSFAHRGVKVDNVKPRIPPEFVQQAKDVADSKLASAAMHQLHGLPVLEIDTGDQHSRRTSIPFAARNAFKARMDCTPS